MVKKTIKLSKYSTEGLIENEYEPGGKVEGAMFLKTQRHFYNLFSEDPPPRITEDLIKELHRHWLGDIYEWAGNYRRVNLEKEGIKFPPTMLQGAANIPRLMKEFERNILRQYTPCPKGDELSKVARAIAIVHGEFEVIHPFREGNGRVGRLIADLMALQAGYPPLIFDIGGKPQNKTIYFVAMKEVFIHKNYEPLTMIAENAITMGIKKAKE